MTYKSHPAELTPGERRAYAALPRDTSIDDSEEERTVRALRARGAFGTHAVASRTSRTWWRAMAIVSAAAAGVIAVLQSTRLHSVGANDIGRNRDTMALADSHANANATQTRGAAAGPDQRRPEKTSLLVWY